MKIGRFYNKIKFSKIGIFIMKQFHKDNKFYQELLNDWGKDDVYGPWTKMEQNPNDELKFYKSYYLISYADDSPNIELIK